MRSHKSSPSLLANIKRNKTYPVIATLTLPGPSLWWKGDDSKLFPLWLSIRSDVLQNAIKFWGDKLHVGDSSGPHSRFVFVLLFTLYINSILRCFLSTENKLKLALFTSSNWLVISSSWKSRENWGSAFIIFYGSATLTIFRMIQTLMWLLPPRTMSYLVT